MALITPRKRQGFWYLIRRVPRRFAAFDGRGIVRASTRIRIVDDPHAIRAAPIAAQLNRDLEASWRALANGEKPNAKKRYDDAVLDARGLGFGYFPTAELMARPIEELVKRVERLIERRSGDVPAEVTAVLGGEDRPVVRTSELLTEYEALSKASLALMSKGQARKWKTQRLRAVENLKAVVGDKPLSEVTRADALKLQAWWSDRVISDGVLIGTANRDIGTIARMFSKATEAKQLNVAPVFAKLRIEGGRDGKRAAYEAAFIQEKFLAPGAFAELNEEARRVIFIMIETGMRPSEICNLTAKRIRLNDPVPHVQVRADDRMMKTDVSRRDIPLVGVALAAMRLQPEGFQRYRDRSASLSATVNKALSARGLRPSPEHSLYSLRHAYEDRLSALKVMPDKIQAYLMGHAYSRPKYGSEPPLSDLHEWLTKIAFTSWPKDL